MPQFRIPPELVSMLNARRVIPFIGAGFSAPLNMPNWEILLTRVAADIGDALPFKEVAECCNGDMLQIAEYYFLKCDKSIGPLRHSIQSILRYDLNPILYSPYHVELVNLGTPQVYTTNFDDIIEITFKFLAWPHEVISLPKHVATSDGRKTQIVKYHGDLRYESTLVLTESSYYSRLDFESPMDLKFRSDLLGRSVLFMGYSFRDLNIRIIWFKLMKMIKDIPAYDRLTSYIVRFEPNPVLEELYADVGIQTIVLDPKKEAASEKQKTQLFGDFMYELSSAVSSDGKIPGTNAPLFLSLALIERIRTKAEEIKAKRVGIPSRAIFDIRTDIHAAAQCRIPSLLSSNVDDLLRHILYATGHGEIRTACAELALSFNRQIGPSKGITYAIAKGLARTLSRDFIFGESPDWGKIWSNKIALEDANQILNEFEKEINAHEQQEPFFNFDHDLAYLADLTKRLEIGALIERDETVCQKADKLIEKAARIYPSILSIEVDSNKGPQVDLVIEDIDQKKKEYREEVADEDVPF